MIASSRLLSAGVDTLNLWLSWAESYNLPETFTERLNTALESFRASGRREPTFVPLLEFATFFNPFLTAGEIPVFEVARISGDKHYAWALVFGQDALTIKFSRQKDSIRRPDYAQVFIECPLYQRCCLRDWRTGTVLGISSLSSMPQSRLSASIE